MPAAEIDVLDLDLGNLRSVADLAKKIQDGGRCPDVLVNNAAVMSCPKMKTDDGFEFQLGINYLGHFRLTMDLMPLMKTVDGPVRIVNVGSAAHQTVPKGISFDDLMSEKQYDPWRAYGQSKLAGIMFTYELARRLGTASPITANSLHPGLIRTELGRYMVDSPSSWWMKPMAQLMVMFFKSPQEGAATSLYLATSPEVEGVTGRYYIDCRPAKSSPASYDTTAARRLWDLSMELVKPSGTL